MLDILRFKYVGIENYLNHYEGQSTLRQLGSRIQISTVTPGNTYIIVREKNYKAVFNPSYLLEFDDFVRVLNLAHLKKNTDEMLFDMEKDANEENNLIKNWKGKIQFPEYKEIFQWFDKAREVAFHFIRRTRNKYGYKWN